MNHIAGVEVVEALSNIRKLITGVSVGSRQQEGNPRVRVGLHRGAS